jgi:hypothetical protein
LRVLRRARNAYFRNGDLRLVNGKCPTKPVKADGKGGVLGAKGSRRGGGRRGGVGHFTG